MDINKEIQRLSSSLQTINSFFDQNDCGKIHIKKRDNSFLLYETPPHEKGEKLKEKYIGSDKEKVKLLLQARYYRSLKPIIQSEIKILQFFSDKFHPEKKYEVFDSFPEQLREQIQPLFLDARTIALLWQDAEYEKNPYPLDPQSTYETKRHELVRSKAEYIIADMLYSFPLCYRNEAVYIWNGKKTYPDFSIMHPKTGEIYYLEYFGMMNDPIYMKNALKKIAFYQQTPDADKFIYIFESEDSPMNISAIRNLLERYFFE